jgi:hypothetical protein
MGELSEVGLLLEVAERLISESKLCIVRDLHKIFRKVVCPVVKAELLAWSDPAKVRARACCCLTCVRNNVLPSVFGLGTQAYLEESCVSKVQLVAKRSSAFVGDTVAAMTGTSPPSGAKAEFSDDFIDNDWCVWYCWMGCPSAVGQSFVPVAFFVAG